MFEVDSNATIAAFAFNPAVVGGAQGTFLIDGGTTTICTGTYNVNSVFAGTLDISNYNEGYTTTMLEDKGKTPLVLVGNNTTIQIGTYATMQVDGGAGTTLISDNQAGNNDYIWDNGGNLNYLGQAGVTDTFTAPVLVGSAAVFSLNGGGGGTLLINGSEQGTSNYSLYSSGKIELSNSISLKTGSGMNCTSISQVATLDSSTDTITVASGNPCIMDGTVLIDTDTGTWGQLVVNCDTLDFDGTLQVDVDGETRKKKGRD